MDPIKQDKIPCMLPDWIYTADPSLFEARQAVKRRKASYFRDVVNLGMQDIQSEEALEEFETLELLSAAREAVNAAQKVESELVHQARSQGISLKKIARLLELKNESGVSNYQKRNPVTPDRQIETRRELGAWAALNWFWANEQEGSDPVEATFLYGIGRLLDASNKFNKAVELRSGKLTEEAHNSLSRVIECFKDPRIPHAIAKYAPKTEFNQEADINALLPGPATAYIKHGIIDALLAKMALDNAIENPSDLLQSGIYMTWALVSLSKPDAFFVSDGMIDFLRREHPEFLLSESGIPLDQIIGNVKRRFDS